MTNPGMFGSRRQLVPTVPRGEVLGTYESYPEAQSVVDRLSKAEFPVKDVSIVGNDLKTVERVTGRLTWGRAALAGALSGLWLGVFLGVVLILFSPTGNIAIVFAAVLIGAAFGMFFGLASAGIQRRSRDFESTKQVLASNYQVIVASGELARAQDLLARGPADPHRAQG
jgi:hypothetical protein